MDTRFALLVPVKPWHRAKSRLGSGLAVGSADFARAFALDAIAAATDCAIVAGVYVVTNQSGFAPAHAGLLPDLGEGDLNKALTSAATVVRRRHPGTPIAAMCADLPSLRADDLAAALEEGSAHEGRWFVADASGTGTTLLAAADGMLLPCFGVDSAQRHRVSGARPLEARVPTLRHDVDTPADLDTARSLGLGPNTRLLLESLAAS